MNIRIINNAFYQLKRLIIEFKNEIISDNFFNKKLRQLTNEFIKFNFELDKIMNVINNMYKKLFLSENWNIYILESINDLNIYFLNYQLEKLGGY